MTLLASAIGTARSETSSDPGRASSNRHDPDDVPRTVEQRRTGALAIEADVGHDGPPR
jgi:hypothetical protein